MLTYPWKIFRMISYDRSTVSQRDNYRRGNFIRKLYSRSRGVIMRIVPAGTFDLGTLDPRHRGSRSDDSNGYLDNIELNTLCGKRSPLRPALI